MHSHGGSLLHSSMIQLGALFYGSNFHILGQSWLTSHPDLNFLRSHLNYVVASPDTCLNLAERLLDGRWPKGGVGKVVGELGL